MTRLVAGVAYAVALAGSLVASAGAVALLAGTGLWGAARLLFVLGFLLVGVAALQWRPAPAWTRTGSGAPGAPWLARRVCAVVGQAPESVPVAPARVGAAVFVLAASYLLDAL